jgi:hypothetical protein
LARRKARTKRSPVAPRAALPAKLSPPDISAAVARPRRFRLLDRATRKPLVWIHAPAGSGKTTLVGSYIAARRAPVVWYDVDAGDADPSEGTAPSAGRRRTHRRAPHAFSSSTGARSPRVTRRPRSSARSRARLRRRFERAIAELQRAWGSLGEPARAADLADLAAARDELAMFTGR